MARNTSGAGKNHRLTKDELLERLSVRTEEFELPAGAGTIIIQGVPLRHLSVIQGVDENTDTHEALKRICLIGIKEPALGPEDLERLDESSVGTVNFIASRIVELSGMSGDKASAFLPTTQPSKVS
jgi:hypothetical protein